MRRKMVTMLFRSFEERDRFEALIYIGFEDDDDDFERLFSPLCCSKLRCILREKEKEIRNERKQRRENERTSNTQKTFQEQR
tara:strand:- start:624 stop:869 length:246 start_codon:yes stop_codon:yes gene_type:complete